MTNEVDQQIEYLRLDRNRRSGPAKLLLADVDLEICEANFHAFQPLLWGESPVAFAIVSGHGDLKQKSRIPQGGVQASQAPSGLQQRGTSLTKEISMSSMTIQAGSAPAIDVSGGGLRPRLRKAGRLAWRGLQPVPRTVFKALMEHRIRRAARELSQLDDRMLKDIGLSRWSLEDAVRSNRTTDLAPFGPEWVWLNGCANNCSGCSSSNNSSR